MGFSNRNGKRLLCFYDDLTFKKDANLVCCSGSHFFSHNGGKTFFLVCQEKTTRDPLIIRLTRVHALLFLRQDLCALITPTVLEVRGV